MAFEAGKKMTGKNSPDVSEILACVGWGPLACMGGGPLACTGGKDSFEVLVPKTEGKDSFGF